MPATLPVHEAKARLPEIVRQASEALQVFAVSNARRKDAKPALILGADALAAMLDGVRFAPTWTEDAEQGLWTVHIPELDVFGQGASRDEAAEDAVESVREYAQLYAEDVRFYFRVGRRAQFPYIMRVLLAMTNGEDMRGVLGI